MPSKKIQISIPKPCSEDWSKMTPTERGRFCAMCTKEVLDFTGMSDSQLVKYLSQTENSICGHIRQNQLNRTILVLNEPISQIQYRPWYERVLAATVFLFTLGSVKGQSQSNVNEVSQNQVTRIEAQSEQLASELGESTPHEIILRGVVLDSLNNEPIVYARILCKEYQRGTSTDFDGNFELKLSLNQIPDSIVLVIYYSHLAEKTITVYKENYTDLLSVLLPIETQDEIDYDVVLTGLIDHVPENDLVDGKISVVRGKIDYREPKPETKSQRFWRRMKFWKRRK